MDAEMRVRTRVGNDPVVEHGVRVGRQRGYAAEACRDAKNG